MALSVGPHVAIVGDSGEPKRPPQNAENHPPCRSRHGVCLADLSVARPLQLCFPHEPIERPPVRYFDAAQRPDPPLPDLSPAEVLNPPESPLRALGRSIHRE